MAYPFAKMKIFAVRAIVHFPVFTPLIGIKGIFLHFA
jgi:hypothetical protein